MTERVHVDANVILRFLRNDDPKQSPQAAELFRRAQAGAPALLVSAVTLMEVFYVLTASYKLTRPDAAGMLVALLNSGAVSCDDGDVTLDALQRITANKVSFGDAYLAATAEGAGEAVASFDKVLARFPGIRLFPIETLA